MNNANPTEQPHRIAYFVTPHGFGHAARSAAVMAAIHEKRPTANFDIYTKVPDWFFAELVPSASFSYHDLQTDIGVIQDSPMQEDLPATIQALDDFLPFNPALVQSLADELRSQGDEMVICDIAPLGIAAAAAAGVPSVLVENFTWDWIYAGYLDVEPRFEPHIRYLRGVFQSASVHIQATPMCEPSPSALVVTDPIGRAPMTPASEVHRKLGIPEGDRMVLVTMGRIQERFGFIDQLPDMKGIHLVIPGASNVPQFAGRLTLLPHHSSFYHPDLIHASDAVIGKAGYSTIAEAYHAGTPFGYVVRQGWRESDYLAEFIERQMPGVEISSSRFENGDLSAAISALLSMPTRWRSEPDGSGQAADYILELLSNHKK